ncbi:MAG: helix-turn-helix domain-containing protein [Hyphomicrobiales bacterium]
MKRARVKVHHSGDNIFADLGLPDAGSQFLKAQIVAELYRLCTVRKLSQSKAGALMGISQPEVSRLFKGHFREYSVERLMHFLTAFSRDVEIVARPSSPKRRAGKISFTSEAT